MTTVNSLGQAVHDKYDAETAAKRVAGVVALANDIEVQPEVLI